MADVAQVFARPYIHDSPEKITYILDQCCEHRAWFDDHVWKDEQQRRLAVSKYLVDAMTYGRVWEVWDGANLVGLLLLNEVQRGVDATCHFIFFDRKLSNKRQLCLNTMRWAFEHYDLHALRVKIPTYARALAHFARKKLGFRYEAEARPFSWPREAKPLTAKQAELGSRKHQGTRYQDEWHDVLLLSVTRDEFYGTNPDRDVQPSDNPDPTIPAGDTRPSS